MSPRLLGRGTFSRERARVQRTQASTFVFDPLVKEPGQQIAAIALQGLGSGSLPKELLELAHVTTDCVRVQCYGLAICVQNRVRRYVGGLEEPAQRRKNLPKTIATDVQIDVRPKQIDELLARVAPLRLQREPRQQHRDRSTRKLRDHGVPARRAQAAEELYLPNCHPLLFRRVPADSDDVEQAIGCPVLCQL
jgi:hypothetical protein